MTTEGKHKLDLMQEGEKLTPIMVYTDNILAWGVAVTMEAIRVSTWLASSAIPQFIYLHNAQVMSFGGVGNPRQQSFPLLHLPTSKIIAFHIKPPAHEPLDYDPEEPMRKMEPITVLVGGFRFDGFLRMSIHTNLEKYLNAFKENFSTIYDVEITQPAFPSLGTFRIPLALVRSAGLIFSPRSV